MPRDDHGNKWACVTCISGHRATTCDHFGRWMVAVKSAGRPSKKCNHPNKAQCDCEGIRMLLMVAIPNGNVSSHLSDWFPNQGSVDKPCECKNGQHECLRGEQFYMTRVANKDEMPQVDSTILDQRQALSEANRAAGCSVRKFKSSQTVIKSENSDAPYLTHDQKGHNNKKHDISNAGPSCCRQTTPTPVNTMVSSKTYGEQSTVYTPQLQEQQRQNYTPHSVPQGYYSMPEGLATIENPMNQRQFQQMEAENPNWQQTQLPGATNLHACSCAPGACQCSACPSHPFNATMNHTVWNLAQNSAAEINKLANASFESPISVPLSLNLPNSSTYAQVSSTMQVDDSFNAVTNFGPTLRSWDHLATPPLPATMDSSTYRFYEYEAGPSGDFLPDHEIEEAPSNMSNGWSH